MVVESETLSGQTGPLSLLYLPLTVALGPTLAAGACQRPSAQTTLFLAVVETSPGAYALQPAPVCNCSHPEACSCDQR